MTTTWQRTLLSKQTTPRQLPNLEVLKMAAILLLLALAVAVAAAAAPVEVRCVRVCAPLRTHTHTCCVVMVPLCMYGSVRYAYRRGGGRAQVFLIPHSHCDAGWIKTVDAYYEEQVQYILSASVNATARDPGRRFHWAEVVFFQRWFDAQPAATQATVRDLVARGQWEFVHGGYVMEDEASATPAARIHQLTVGSAAPAPWPGAAAGTERVNCARAGAVQLGHEYLERTFGVRPSVAWSIDPFGSSGVSPALFRGSGYRVLVNDRISLRLKEVRRLAHARALVCETNTQTATHAHTCMDGAHTHAHRHGWS
jgi:hypothetical protein